MKTITVFFVDALPASFEATSWRNDGADYVIRDGSVVVASIPRHRVLYVMAVNVPSSVDASVGTCSTSDS